MIYELKYSTNCNLHKGHMYYVGMKVKVNVDKLLKYYKEQKSVLITQKTYSYIERIREQEFTIRWIEGHPCFANPPGVILNEFPHILDVDDLMLI